MHKELILRSPEKYKVRKRKIPPYPQNILRRIKMVIKDLS